MSIRIISDYSELDAELDRVEDQPDFRTRSILDATLGLLAAEVEAATHVETGSLSGSVKSTSTTNDAIDRWEGEIEVGGASTGPNNPVDYAIYEKARGVGGAGGPSDAKGDHNFMAPAELTGDEKFGTAVLTGLAGSGSVRSRVRVL